jgi:hypothetical protein
MRPNVTPLQGAQISAGVRTRPDPKATFAGNCFEGAKVPRPEVAIKDEYKTARVIGQLEAAQDLHQIVNLASGGGPTLFKVLLHTQARKESQDHTR